MLVLGENLASNLNIFPIYQTKIYGAMCTITSILNVKFYLQYPILYSPIYEKFRLAQIDLNQNCLMNNYTS